MQIQKSSLDAWKKVANHEFKFSTPKASSSASAAAAGPTLPVIPTLIVYPLITSSAKPATIRVVAKAPKPKTAKPVTVIASGGGGGGGGGDSKTQQPVGRSMEMQLVFSHMYPHCPAFPQFLIGVLYEEAAFAKVGLDIANIERRTKIYRVCYPVTARLCNLADERTAHGQTPEDDDDDDLYNEYKFISLDALEVIMGDILKTPPQGHRFWTATVQGLRQAVTFPIVDDSLPKDKCRWRTPAEIADYYVNTVEKEARANLSGEEPAAAKLNANGKRPAEAPAAVPAVAVKAAAPAGGAVAAAAAVAKAMAGGVSEDVSAPPAKKAKKSKGKAVLPKSPEMKDVTPVEVVAEQAMKLMDSKVPSSTFSDSYVSPADRPPLVMPAPIPVQPDQSLIGMSVDPITESFPETVMAAFSDEEEEVKITRTSKSKKTQLVSSPLAAAAAAPAGVPDASPLKKKSRLSKLADVEVDVDMTDVTEAVAAVAAPAPPLVPVLERADAPSGALGHGKLPTLEDVDVDMTDAPAPATAAAAPSASDGVSAAPSAAVARATTAAAAASAPIDLITPPPHPTTPATTDISLDFPDEF